MGVLSLLGLLAPLLAGSAIILPAGGRFSAKTFWKDACDHGATFYTAVPTMHQVRACLHEEQHCEGLLVNHSSIRSEA